MYKYSNKEHTTVTNVETGASGIHPGNWMWRGYQDWIVAGGITEPFQSKEELLAQELQLIDEGVQLTLLSPFKFNGHNYYPDTEFIQGVFSALPLLPSDFTEVWKTADKAENGVDNIYVTLDKQGITGLAMAYLSFKKSVWSDGEKRKIELKTSYLANNK